jgi:hypothetical protein
LEITGLNPTGSISFTANGAALGTAPVIKGDAVLVVSFPAAGTYSVTATYSGDNNNQPSSTTVSIPVAQVAPSVGFGASTLTPGANQPLTLSVSMGGYVPTGTITFSFTGGATIGTATLVQSNTTFTYAFPAAGKYSVTASYSGDAANLPATSDAIAFTVLVPDFLFSSPGAIATITAGQSATTTLNIISEYGYHGTINFSCSGLTTGENCTFTPASLTAPADGQLISSTIVTSTTTSAYLNGLAEPLRGIAWASLLCLALSPRRIRQLNLRLIRASVFTLLLLIGFIHLTGCSSGSSSPSGSQNSGTPKGTQTITVTAADSAGGPSHSLTLQLTVQ